MYRVPDHFWETFPDQVQQEVRRRQRRQRQRRKILAGGLAGIAVLTIGLTLHRYWLNTSLTSTTMTSPSAVQTARIPPSTDGDQILLSYLEETVSDDEILELAEALPKQALPQ